MSIAIEVIKFIIIGVVVLFCVGSFVLAIKSFSDIVDDLDDTYVTDEKVLKAFAVIMCIFAPLSVLWILLVEFSTWAVHKFQIFLESVLLNDEERERCIRRRLHGYRRGNTFRL